MLTKPTFLAITLLLLSSTAWAEEAALGLYEAEVTVEDQGAEQRQQALREALEEVLNKAAEAQELTVDKARITAALDRAERYVQQYRYTEDGLWVLFDRRAIDAVLEQQLGAAGAANSQTLLLKVTGINALPDYAEVMHYLNSLKVLSKVQPRIVAPDAVLFELGSRNGRQKVVQAILHDRFLQQGAGDAPILSFHYSP